MHVIEVVFFADSVAIAEAGEEVLVGVGVVVFRGNMVETKERKDLKFCAMIQHDVD